MAKIKFNEFIPPIVPRTVSYFQRKFFKNSSEQPPRIHPFDSIPDGLNIEWILDVGANRGDVTIAGLESFPNSKVICFEPVKQTFVELKERLAAYADRTFLFNHALSETKEEGEINITTFHGANSISPQANFHQIFNPHVREIGKEKISLVRLDDVAEDFPHDKIDIMKIDVEGHELSVLKGGLNFISNNVDILIIEISMMRDLSWEEQAIFPIFALLNEAGFCLINITDLYPAKNENLLLAQMDCIFRHKRYLGIS